LLIQCENELLTTSLHFSGGSWQFITTGLGPALL